MILLWKKGPDLELRAEVFTEEMTSQPSLEGEGGSRKFASSKIGCVNNLLKVGLGIGSSSHYFFYFCVWFKCFRIFKKLFFKVEKIYVQENERMGKT